MVNSGDGGGSAFPNSFMRNDTGMSLRDYFAASALSALIQNPPAIGVDVNAGTNLIWAATRRAYAFADAMLSARGEA